MTRPMSEDSPGKQAANYGYRIRQLERRPAPVTDPVDFVHFSSWNYDTSNTIPTATWRAVCNLTNDSYYEQVLVVGDGWTYDFDDGTVGVEGSYDYLISGWVQWWDDASDGEKRITALEYGSSDRYIAVFPFESAMGSIAGLKLAVTNPRSTVLGTTDVNIEVWHNHGSDISIRDSELAVYRMRPYAAEDIVLRP